MVRLPLHHRDGHLFLELDSGLWLLDTGAPTSFGPAIELGGREFPLRRSKVADLSAEALSRYVGVPLVGLLGTDVLGQFDWVIDSRAGAATISDGQLDHPGQCVRLEEFMTIPIVSARIGGADYRMFLDTGAQISYFEDDSLDSYPAAGRIRDFYPGLGQFETDTYNVEMALGPVLFTLRCGALPRGLAALLKATGTEGIVGNQIFSRRTVGYFPRRHLLVL